MNRKVKSVKQRFYRNNVPYQKLQNVFEVQSFGCNTGPQSFCHSFIALSITPCLKSAKKFTVWVCQVVTVVMETTQLVLSQFKNCLSYQLRIAHCANHDVVMEASFSYINMLYPDVAGKQTRLWPLWRM